jgi:glycosyltransferase involved in cell wall biosynthesis
MLDNWQLHLVGDGPKRVECEQLVTSTQMHQRVRFHGSQKELTPYYAEAGVFVLPSYYEGFPKRST